MCTLYVFRLFVLGPFARFRSSRGRLPMNRPAALANSSSSNTSGVFERISNPNADRGNRANAVAPANPSDSIPGTMTTAGAASALSRSALSGHLDRVAGCLLGKMCADVLGAGVEGWSPADIQLSNPNGLTDFLNTERGFGCYTDDTQMAIALTRSLIACNGRIDDVHAAQSYAEEYQPCRGYGGTAYKILSGIRRLGVDSESIRTIGTKLIPTGSFGNGGAMRIAPLGLVYRHAPPKVLREAVAAALRCTHVHPVAVDGAFVIALAVGYLALRRPAAAAAAATNPSACGPAAAVPAAGSATTDNANGSADGGSNSGAAVATAITDELAQVATPLLLLEYLLSHSPLLETDGMVQKLQAVKAFVVQARQFKGPNESWAEYFSSPGWAAELQLQAEVSEPFQIRADDAAAVALAALCCHWDRPDDAVVAAVHYGGDTDTVAAITGAMAGALYGTQWLPARWYDNLENGTSGRDEVLQLAVELARFDTCT
ncbi:hypothetical protein Vretifemale_7135 [Volvox reticuliferus]|nr:hypothetical protein Vretifemale_7135 [Volvox reticuliferus]